MAIRTTPDQAASRWAAALGAASQKITEGIQRVNQAPGQKAAAQRQKYLNGVNASVDKWANRVGRVSLADWQQAAIQKGVPRVAQGAQAAQPKFQQAITPVFAYMGSVLSQLDTMDSSTPAARDQRMLYFANAMRQYSAQG